MRSRWSTAAALVVGAIALTGCTASDPAAATAPGSPDRAGISARGVGTVTGTPDVASVVLGVQTQGQSAKGALDANTERATALIATLKAAGVADADIRTSQLSINPTYGPTSGRITGYQVTNQVTATRRDITAAGGLIDAAAGAAGNDVRVDGLSFSIDDDSALRARARADSVRLAQAQAQQMAEAAGVALGPIRSISDVTSAPPVPFAEDNARAALAPVQPGTQELTVSVDIVYEIAQ